MVHLTLNLSIRAGLYILDWFTFLCPVFSGSLWFGAS